MLKGFKNAAELDFTIDENEKWKKLFSLLKRKKDLYFH